MNEQIQGTGYIKDLVDLRDYKYEDRILGSLKGLDIIFQEIDLRDEFMPIMYESQGLTNSCVAYSTIRALEYQVNKVFEKKFHTNLLKFNNALSKKFLYYTTRYLSGNEAELTDGGSSFRYAFQALMRTGTCIQKLHNDTSSVSLKPTYDAVINANDYKINAYYKIETLEGIVDSLKLGIPVLIGTNIDAFDDARNNGGFSNKSETWTTRFIGNHAMLIVGLKNINNVWHFIIANSYGNTWGDKGYCYMNVQKMWDYNIEVAYVFVLDTLVADLDRENKNYLNSQELPSNSTIIGKYAFDLDYANDIKNVDEIQKKIISSGGNIFIKTVSGELINNNTSLPITVEEIIIRVGNKLIYKDKKGEEISFFLRG